MEKEIFNKQDERFTITSDGRMTCTRAADASVRFTAHPAGHMAEGLMELFHNMFSYGKSYGEVEIKKRCGGEEGYCRLYNDADVDMLPTFNDIKDIATTAGKSITAGKGVSLCGVGMEVMGLSSRKYAESVVNMRIEVVRNKLAYGLEFKFNGVTKRIDAFIIEPRHSDAANSFQVTVDGECQCLTDEELLSLERRIVDSMPNNGFTIMFDTDSYKKRLDHVDFLYRKELQGTDNYVKHTFHAVDYDNEELCLEMADVSSIVNSGKGVSYEEGTNLAPGLSGGAVRHDGIATICRGTEGWKVVGNKIHTTKHNIRFELTVGKAILRKLHQESQLKIMAVNNTNNLTGPNNEVLRLIDENGKTVKITKIKKLIDEFVRQHKTDNKSKKASINVIDVLTEKVKDGETTLDDINATIKVLGFSGDCKMHVSNFREKILGGVVKRFNAIENKVKEPCYSCAR